MTDHAVTITHTITIDASEYSAMDISYDNENGLLLCQDSDRILVQSAAIPALLKYIAEVANIEAL